MVTSVTVWNDVVGVYLYIMTHVHLSIRLLLIYCMPLMRLLQHQHIFQLSLMTVTCPILFRSSKRNMGPDSESLFIDAGITVQNTSSTQFLDSIYWYYRQILPYTLYMYIHVPFWKPGVSST